ncbi:bacterial membrane flanked domain protein [Oceanobacillus picturae]|uniref:Bacterial membrane flanked domain protein n=1 Tax=Oceanobacillus picturae TaxID=171693 RepID=A0A0U9HZT5_9BACI|nr:PH domain-containing protein [Oceanobacillus picturae]GAQ18221.1 bacterial membrane flanked domain protein [Oceanobacillus picturae]
MSESLLSPNKKLSKKAVKVWRLTETISNVISLIVLAILFYLDFYFSWVYWIGWILIGLVVIGIVGGIWGYIKPGLLYKHWRYDISEEFLQLKSGAIKEEHQLVPMTKIQSVSTKQGPLLRKYALYAVTVQTMGSTHTIPALEKAVATELRNTIAKYAKVEEMEE